MLRSIYTRISAPPTPEFVRRANFFVSTSSDSGVAVNLGGACGGFWYFAGAIEAFVSGLALLYVGASHFGG